MIATMRLSRPLFVVLITALAACGPGTADSTTSTAESTTTTAGDTTTTTTTTPTTTTLPEVTIDPYLPEARGRSAIPFDEVDAGWSVILYDSSDASGEATYRAGPSVLYLVHNAGDLFEVASWEPEAAPYLVDATATAALVLRAGSNPDEHVYEYIDLTTGETSVVHTVGFDESSRLDTWPLASLTRPTGENVLVHRADTEKERLERRSPDGTVLSVVYERPFVERGTDLTWLYGFDGTFVVVASSAGMSTVSINGEQIGDLWTPPDTSCDPVRWWDSETVLVRCNQTDPETALVDEDGNPHLYYGWLWLIPIDGTAGTVLTALPTEPTSVVDFGYQDAWPVDDEVLVQWAGDCSAAGVAILDDDGRGEFLELDLPEVAGGGSRMLGVLRGEIMLYGWDSCGQMVGLLFTAESDGTDVEVLVAPIEDARGVIGAVSLNTVYP